MSQPQPEPRPDAGPLNTAVRTYLLVGLGALLVLLLTMLQRGSALGALMAVVVGVAGLLARWRTAPVVLLSVASFSLFDWTGGHLAGARDGPFELGDLLLVAALVTYLGAQYRLFSLTSNSLPQPPRRPGRPAVKQPSRPAALVSDGELVGLAAAGLAAAVGAQVLWGLLPAEVHGWTLPPAMVRLTTLTLLLGGGSLLVMWVLGHLAFRRSGPLAGALVLQDMLWEETRREQRRLGRWMAWARLRARRAKPTTEETS